MDFAHARRSFEAACLLAVRNEKGGDGFELTSEGFFKSFSALPLVIPLNIMFDLFAVRLAEARASADGGPVSHGSYAFGEALFSTAVLGVEWLIFPLVAALLVWFLGIQSRFVPFIVAHNWGRVVTELLNLPAIVLFSMGLISHQIAMDLLFITLGLTLYYRFYIAQSALGVSWGLAIAVSVLELLVTILFSVVIYRGASLWLPV